MHLSDGSSFHPIQVVAPSTLPDYADDALRLTAGCAVEATGTIVPSQGKGQSFEMQANTIKVIGWVDDPDTYPIQPKPHTMEFLREVAHLRPRTNVIGAATRVRHTLAKAIHRFFDDNGFLWVNTPRTHAWMNAASTRNTMAGTGTCAATVRCLTQVSASASSARLHMSPVFPMCAMRSRFPGRPATRGIDGSATRFCELIAAYVHEVSALDGHTQSPQMTRQLVRLQSGCWLRLPMTGFSSWVSGSYHHVPRGLARAVGVAEAGSSGQACRG